MNCLGTNLTKPAGPDPFKRRAFADRRHHGGRCRGADSRMVVSTRASLVLLGGVGEIGVECYNPRCPTKSSDLFKL
jgi:hypothetical protein